MAKRSRFQINQLGWVSSQASAFDRFRLAACVLGLLLVLSACGSDMRDQARYKPLALSEFFPDRQSSRPLLDGTVPQVADFENSYLYTGRTEEGQMGDSLPFEVTQELLERGRDEYNAFCSPCHGFDGEGQGMIVQRGFSAPPSLQLQRLVEAPEGHYFDVITNGWGQMYSYGYRIKPEDRWAIIAYIRALQLSQNASIDDVPQDARQQLESAP